MARPAFDELSVECLPDVPLKCGEHGSLSRFRSTRLGGSWFAVCPVCGAYARREDGSMWIVPKDILNLTWID